VIDKEAIIKLLEQFPPPIREWRMLRKKRITLYLDRDVVDRLLRRGLNLSLEVSVYLHFLDLFGDDAIDMYMGHWIKLLKGLLKLQRDLRERGEEFAKTIWSQLRFMASTKGESAFDEALPLLVKLEMQGFKNVASREFWKEYCRKIRVIEDV